MTSIIRWTATFAIPMGLLRAYNIARGNDVVWELLGFIVGGRGHIRAALCLQQDHRRKAGKRARLKNLSPFYSGFDLWAPSATIRLADIRATGLGFHETLFPDFDRRGVIRLCHHVTPA